jgi:hypothetical protein
LLERGRAQFGGYGVSDVAEDIGYDGVEWCSRVSMEGVISFDVLLDVVYGYCDEVGGKVYVKDGYADVRVKYGGD